MPCPISPAPTTAIRVMSSTVIGIFLLEVVPARRPRTSDRRAGSGATEGTRDQWAAATWAFSPTEGGTCDVTGDLVYATPVHGAVNRSRGRALAPAQGRSTTGERNAPIARL